MLSFEEFFAKKKIDLPALRIGQPALYEEFLLHYEQMGEKSFDHTKKYWFNNLRKLYHLDEVEVSIAPAKPKISTSQGIAQNEEATLSKLAGFKPRFKTTVPKSPESTSVVPEPENKDQVATPQEETKEKLSTGTESTPSKPAGFKPRFKAGVTKSSESAPANAPEPENKDQVAKSQEEVKEKPSTETELTTSKPAGFKPRFKAGVTKPSESAPANAPEPENKDQVATPQEEVKEKPSTETEPTASKPTGFKPRFKAGVTKSSESAPANAPEPESKDQVATPQEETKEKLSTGTESTPSKPAGFKPRFKAGVTKSSENAPANAPEPENKDQGATPQEEVKEKPSTEMEPTASKPTGFKPRFKAGVTKSTGSSDSNKSGEEIDSASTKNQEDDLGKNDEQK